jgi:orotidine-5'-phosphate decarboxylase
VGETFGRRLATVMHERSPLCVGIDPSADLLRAWGLADDASGLQRFAAIVLDAVADVVGVVKPQSAFFERMGSAGVAVLEQLCADARSRGLLVVLDVKRGDIGSTSQAYAQAYLDAGSPFSVDAITTAPYLGVGALAPMFDAAHASGRGVFVVARSSNPEGAAIQDAVLPDAPAEGRRHDVVAHVLSELGRANAAARTEPGLGSIGVVFGATCNADGYDLPGFGGPILAPGLGAQGATVDDIARRFAACREQVLPTSSRGVLAAGPDVAAVRSAAAQLAAECRRALAS